MSLKLKRQTFCEEYIVDLNATQAAIRAGFSAKTANRIASNLLSKVDIQAEIQRLQAERSKRTEVTADRVVVELARIAFGDRRKLFSWGPGGVTINSSDDLDDASAAMVEEVSQTITESGGTIRIKTASKTEALKLVGQHLGVYVERHEHSGPGGKPIAVTDGQRLARIAELIDIARARGVVVASGGGNGKPAPLGPSAGTADDGVR